jgi:phage terminase large subunit GpA-like protein
MSKRDKTVDGALKLDKYADLAARRRTAFRRAVIQLIRIRFAPESFQSVTDWAADNRYLPGTASEPGRYVAGRLPYQRAIQDSFTIPGVREITVMAAERIGKSTIATNILGYIMDRQPAGVLWVLPSKIAMEDFVADEVDPMIRQSTRLRRKVASQTRREGSNSIRRKTFQGGQVTFVGGGSSTQLAVRTVKFVIIDEADKLRHLPREGDADALVAKRITTFSETGGMVLRFSKPTTEDKSRINRHFLRGSQTRWFLQCPNPECGEFVNLRWAHIHFEDARGYCEYCGRGADQNTWLNQPGEPREAIPHPTHKSFQLSALFNPFIRWETLIEEFKQAQEALEEGDPSLMSVFQNSRLGEPSGAFGEYKIEVSQLYDRRSYFGEAEIPDGIIGLTLGADTQTDGFRWLLCGWGRRHEVWLIQTGSIVGDMSAQLTEGPWAELAGLFRRLWYDREGNGYRPLLTGLDVQGDHYERCLQFVRLNAAKGLRAMRGLGADKRKSTQQKASIIRNVYFDKALKVPIQNIDVDAAKTAIGTMLIRKEPSGPGIVHFPCGQTGEEVRGFDLDAIAEFTAEYRRKKMVNGYPVYTWHKHMHLENHRLDCFVYGLAAMLLTHIDFDIAGPRRIPSEKFKEAKEQGAESSSPPAPGPTPRQRPRSTWNNWRR